MNCLAQRPAHVPRSRACDALALSRTGTYPRRRRSRARAATGADQQPRELSAVETEHVLATVNSTAYQDAQI
jgi:hypothetical protein